MSSPIELTGLDGANPLAFLASVGTLRVADQAFPGCCCMRWVSRGKWMPVLEMPIDVDADRLVAELYTRLHRTADPAAVAQVRKLQKEYEALNKQAKEAAKQVKARKLRGEARDRALREEVDPLLQRAEAGRATWLQALAKTVPALFLTLGKSLSVSQDEYRELFARPAAARLHAGIPNAGAGAGPLQNPAAREDADFAAAFGSDACVLDNGNIKPTEFQLISGSGHQFFLETFGILMKEITPEKIRRALLGPWTYTDPRRSFRWDPSEDRRYAYGWSNPSDDEVLTEHGANLLAAMALPLFPAVPTERRLATTGFESRGDPPTFTWPIWEPAVGPDVVRSMLALAVLRFPAPDRTQLRRLGIVEVFRTTKIEVGRPPLSKLNLTPSVAV